MTNGSALMAKRMIDGLPLQASKHGIKFLLPSQIPQDPLIKDDSPQSSSGRRKIGTIKLVKSSQHSPKEVDSKFVQQSASLPSTFVSGHGESKVVNTQHHY